MESLAGVDGELHAGAQTEVELVGSQTVIGQEGGEAVCPRIASAVNTLNQSVVGKRCICPVQRR